MNVKHQKQCSNLSLRSEGLYSSLSRSLLSAAKVKYLHKVHSQIITCGLQKSLFFSGQLISKYSQFKDPNSALSVFHANSSTTYAYIWNTIIRAMTQNGLFAKSLGLYGKMRASNVKPDKYTFPSVINACGRLKDFEKGIFVHEHVLELGFEFDLYINNALVDMYSRCNALDRARGVFDEMPNKDIVSWNSLISGYTSNGFFSEALEIYFQLRTGGLVPDYSTFSSVLLSCGGLGQIMEGEIVHGLVEKVGVRRYMVVNNLLLSMYIKFDMLVNYRKIFNEMVDKDKVTCNTMICGLCECALYEESIRLFTDMVGHFEPDILTISSVLRACTYLRDLKSGKYVHDYMVSNGYECDTMTTNIIINMYAKCGDLVGSRYVFESMKNPDLVSWNSLIKGYVENQFYEEAVKLFSRMRMICEPDSVTYVTLLCICTNLINKNLTEELHNAIIKHGFDSGQIVANSLVDAYAKCGQLEDSLKQFENMDTRDKVSWNSIIAACGYSDNSILGFRILKRMRLEGMVPDVPTLVSALPLCSYLIARRQGKEMHGCIFRLGFESIIPIGNALIEMYSNTGNLRNSVLVFEQMKARDVVSWTTMIASYGMYGEGRKALKAFENMKATGFPMDHVVFIAIIYACSHSGLVQEGRTCFEQMKKHYNIEPGLEHYACVVDLLSRSGLLIEAEKFITMMPLKPDASIWGALLSACRASGDMKMAEQVSGHITELNVDNPGYHVLASNVYAALGKWNQVEMIRTSLKDRGLKKDPGCSWVEVQNRVYYFRAGDRFFEKHEEVMKLLNSLSSLMAKEGYAAYVKSVLKLTVTHERDYEEVGGDL
ncbi:pentatricopeptide repeat-containing protein-like [Dorcoceras hygrometricum]|uniref:Pentatricopeptide repeat-containing protein-like n=1 Tax=Dorcoceras hygrometricum TaxID=472368 RepID=A0A2Z7AR19_9LAMI|nr:pentatricopeptide repeat-containing protein-like [Dorcoceras hygrometricum]